MIFYHSPSQYPCLWTVSSCTVSSSPPGGIVSTSLNQEESPDGGSTSTSPCSLLQGHGPTSSEGGVDQANHSRVGGVSWSCVTTHSFWMLSLNCKERDKQDIWWWWWWWPVPNDPYTAIPLNLVHMKHTKWKPFGTEPSRCCAFSVLWTFVLRQSCDLYYYDVIKWNMSTGEWILIEFLHRLPCEKPSNTFIFVLAHHVFGYTCC